MKSKRRAPRRGGGPGRFRTSLEWIGGLLSPPFFITDREEPYRPEMVVWMELPSGLVVGNEVIAPEQAGGAVARALAAALKRPLAGPPRWPDTIRVADASLAAEVRATIGGGTPVVVAPTPELDAFLETMRESMPGQHEDPSYLEGGRIPPTTVKSLFAAAGILCGVAPWKVATDDRVLRLDVPALGVDGACVSIIGQLGESRGFLVFPSIAGYEAFRRGAEERLPRKKPADFGTDWLALCFEREEDLPASMLREVAAHIWHVNAADAYPRVERRDSDGASRPLVERDLKIATACAASLSTFFIKHRSLFEAGEFEPVCESFFDENDLEVRLTLPYEAFALFDVDESPERRPAPLAGAGGAGVGRNDPCPCGSGRKYKKCHLPSDKQRRAAESAQETVHDRDGRLVHELMLFAADRFGSEWQRHVKDFFDPAEALQFVVPWSVYGYPVQNATVLDGYLEESGDRLPRADRTWLEAQRASWLSVWEVTEVEPGMSLALHDLLSGETRRVREVSASQTLVARDALLARVVDHEGVSVMCGVYPRPLPPIDAAEVVRRARGRLRRKRAVPVERLRDGAFGRYLIRRWEDAVAEFDERRSVPRRLSNTDGDDLILTIDHYEIAPGARSAVEARLAALENVEQPDPDQDPTVYTFLRPGNPMHANWENTLIGRAQLSGSRLRLETNSRERADALRERIEAACGDRIRYRVREHTDPLSPKAALALGDTPPEPTPPEVEQMLLEFKEQHYADWVDQPLSALGDKTPRETARTARGRSAVDVLLKDMENHERRSDGGAAFDFGKIRRELRLE